MSSVLTKADATELRRELADIRRKLGPYTALQPSEAYRLNDAEIARSLVHLADVVDKVLHSLGGERP